MSLLIHQAQSVASTAFFENARRCLMHKRPGGNIMRSATSPRRERAEDTQKRRDWKVWWQIGREILSLLKGM
jgi:hypothetical protein